MRELRDRSGTRASACRAALELESPLSRRARLRGSGPVSAGRGFLEATSTRSAPGYSARPRVAKPGRLCPICQSHCLTNTHGDPGRSVPPQRRHFVRGHWSALRFIVLQPRHAELRELRRVRGPQIALGARTCRRTGSGEFPVPMLSRATDCPSLRACVTVQSAMSSRCVLHPGVPRIFHAVSAASTSLPRRAVLPARK